jgi:plasmid stabilization system protein ParE
VNWNVIVLPRAHRDYLHALEYLSGFYPGTPLRFRSEYQKRLSQLEDSPYGCPVYYAFPDYRRVLVGKYTMLYKIDDEYHEVHIHRILRSNWDIPRRVQEEEEE